MSRPALKGFLSIFRPAPPASAMLTDQVEVKAKYHHWQIRVLILSIAGYATFYFVRKNLGMAMPEMERQLGISKSQLGLFLT